LINVFWKRSRIIAIYFNDYQYKVTSITVSKLLFHEINFSKQIIKKKIVIPLFKFISTY